MVEFGVLSVSNPTCPIFTQVNFRIWHHISETNHDPNLSMLIWYMDGFGALGVPNLINVPDRIRGIPSRIWDMVTFRTLISQIENDDLGMS
jgi:hypothetical protein